MLMRSMPNLLFFFADLFRQPKVPPVRAYQTLTGPTEAAASHRKLPAHVGEDLVQFGRVSGDVTLASEWELQQGRCDGVLCSDREKPLPPGGDRFSGVCVGRRHQQHGRGAAPGWASTACCAPCHKDSPFATTSMRRSSDFVLWPASIASQAGAS